MPEPQQPVPYTPCTPTQAQQSPVNLKDPVVTDFGDNGLKINWDGMASGHLSSDEKGVKVTFGFDSRLFVVLDTWHFFLQEFHFHHPSEHAVDGKQMTVELHAVHQNLDDGTLAILGIFIEAGNDETLAPPLVSTLGSLLKGVTAQCEHAVVSLKPADYLPKNTAEYYRYEGSLTTPPFTENASWAVLRKPKEIPEQELSTLIVHVGHPARLPQPLNRRFILANFKE